MTTKYEGWGNLYRYGGFYGAVFIIISIILIPMIEPNFAGSYCGYIIALFLVLLWEQGYLWLHPILKINEDYVEVIRLKFVKRKIKWRNLRLNKRVRSISKQLGIDPRYAVLEIKDCNFFDRFIFVLPFFNDYDKFIKKIEDSLDAKEVYTENKYY